LTKDSCVSACGEMLSEGRLKQIDLIRKLGAPVSILELGAALGPEWFSNYVNPLTSFDIAMRNGKWSATFFDRLAFGLPHAVIVEGVTEAGTVLVTDPWEASTYEMTKENFLLHWNGGAAFRR
jgi:hypothetical protein